MFSYIFRGVSLTTDHYSQRDDVASILYKLAARQDAAGLAIDIVGGKGEIDSQLDEFIKKGVSDFLG